MASVPQRPPHHNRHNRVFHIEGPPGTLMTTPLDTPVDVQGPRRQRSAVVVAAPPAALRLANSHGVLDGPTTHLRVEPVLLAEPCLRRLHHRPHELRRGRRRLADSLDNPGSVAVAVPVAQVRVWMQHTSVSCAYYLKRLFEDHEFKRSRSRDARHGSSFCHHLRLPPFQAIGAGGPPALDAREVHLVVNMVPLHQNMVRPAANPKPGRLDDTHQVKTVQTKVNNKLDPTVPVRTHTPSRAESLH